MRVCTKCERKEFKEEGPKQSNMREVQAKGSQDERVRRMEGGKPKEGIVKRKGQRKRG
jgi:hypothetical protein